MCVLVVTGDGGGAVFKNYEHRTIQVNSCFFSQHYITNKCQMVILTISLTGCSGQLGKQESVQEEQSR